MVNKEVYFRSETDRAAVDAAWLAFQAISNRYLNRPHAGVTEILANAARARREVPDQEQSSEKLGNTTWAGPAVGRSYSPES